MAGREPGVGRFLAIPALTPRARELLPDVLLRGLHRRSQFEASTSRPTVSSPAARRQILVAIALPHQGLSILRPGALQRQRVATIPVAPALNRDPKLNLPSPFPILALRRRPRIAPRLRWPTGCPLGRKRAHSDSIRDSTYRSRRRIARKRPRSGPLGCSSSDRGAPVWLVTIAWL